MKWGRHASSPSSVITRVFPSTWFSKFKQTKQPRGKLDFPTSGRREAKFYSLDNDPYWTLSFRKKRVVNIPPCDYEDDFQVAASSFKNETDQTTDNNTIKRGECRIKEEEDGGLREKKALIKRQRARRRAAKRKVFPADQVKEELEVSTNHHQNITFHKHSLSSIKEDYEEEEDEDDVITDLDSKGSSSSTSEGVSNLETQNLQNKRFELVKVKTRRRYRSRKLKQKKQKKAHKIKKCRNQAVEEMKNAKEEGEEGSTVYSYAVVKSSFNPQQDFKDSMVEMIEEKGIWRREELVELLACYLTLNSDGHHDLIINAFQQVWLEINGGEYDSE